LLFRSGEELLDLSWKRKRGGGAQEFGLYTWGSMSVPTFSGMGGVRKGQREALWGRSTGVGEANREK